MAMQPMRCSRYNRQALLQCNGARVHRKGLSPSSLVRHQRLTNLVPLLLRRQTANPRPPLHKQGKHTIQPSYLIPQSRPVEFPHPLTQGKHWFSRTQHHKMLRQNRLQLPAIGLDRRQLELLPQKTFSTKYTRKPLQSLDSQMCPKFLHLRQRQYQCNRVPVDIIIPPRYLPLCLLFYLRLLGITYLEKIHRDHPHLLQSNTN